MNIDLFWKLMAAVPGRVAWVVGLILLQPAKFEMSVENSGLWAMVFIGLAVEMGSYIRNNFKAPKEGGK